MNMRLAFGVAKYSQGDVFLIDEVLRVGDKEFREKCYDFFEKIKKQGKTIVFVSHNFEDIKKHCNRVLVLDKGKIVYDGKPESAVEFYDKITEENQ